MMFNSDEKIHDIDHQLEKLNKEITFDSKDLEIRIITEAKQNKSNVVGVYKPKSFYTWPVMPIAACLALLAVFFWLPVTQDLGNSSEVVAFDELELQEMWLLQDQLLFDNLNL